MSSPEPRGIVTRGHTLVALKRHVANYPDLGEREQQACWLLVNRVQSLLRDRFDPDDFTAGVNLEGTGVQISEHAHIHVLPQ